MSISIAANDLRSSFLQGMSCAANTVNVVTTDGRAGRAGVTVSAMASVSADGDAPSMLVCVHHLSPSAKTIIDNGCFCTNILRDDQSYISDTFAGRVTTEDGDKFSCAEWQPMITGAVRVKDPLTAFDCRVISSERVGTHYVFIGEVQDVFVAASGNPLIFSNRAYGSPVKINPPRKDRSNLAKVRVGILHTFGPYLLPGIVRNYEDSIGPLDLDLHEGDQRYLLELLRAGSIDMAFVYDFDLGSDICGVTVSSLPPYVLLAEGDPLAGRDTIKLADLRDRPMILLDAPPSRDYFLSLFDEVGTPNISYKVSSFEMARGMVAHGLGYCLLATKPASSMSYDGKSLVMRSLADTIPASRLMLTQKKEATHSAAAGIFLQHCLNYFSIEVT